MSILAFILFPFIFLSNSSLYITKFSIEFVKSPIFLIFKKYLFIVDLDLIPYTLQIAIVSSLLNSCKGITKLTLL